MASETGSKSAALLQTARTWSGVAFIFLAILGTAGLLFIRHTEQRSAELQQQYARSADRMAHQLELKYQNYRQLLDNVTRVLASAQTVADSERREALQNALAKLKTKQERQANAFDQADKANKLSGTIDRALKALHDKANAAEAREADLLTVARDAAHEELRLFRDVAEKEQRVEGRTADRDAILASLEAVQIEASASANAGGGVGASQDASTNSGGAASLSQGGATVGGATSGGAGAGLGGSVASAGSATASVGAGGAVPYQDRIAALQASLRSAESALDQAGDAAFLAWLLAVEAHQRTLDAWSATTAATREREQSNKNVVDQEAAQKGALSDVQRTAQELQSAAQGLKQASEEAADAQSQSAPVVASRFRDQLQKVVFASYWPEIARCPYANLNELMLCAARTISRLSSTASEHAGIAGDNRLQFVSCPAKTENSGAAERSALAADGSLLLLPVGDAARLASQICGRVELKELWPAAAGAVNPGGFQSAALIDRTGAALHVSPSDPAIVSLPALGAAKPTAATMLTNVSLGTELYRAFLSPVKVRLSGALANTETGSLAAETSSERADLLLAGFVAEKTLARAKLEIDLPSYLWVVLLLCVGLLALPLAKLWLLGTFTSFRRFDVTLLATSGLITTLLTVVLFLSLVAHNRLWQRADEQSKAVATRLKQRLENDLNTAAKYLNSFTKSTEVQELRPALSRDSDIAARAVAAGCRGTGRTTSALFDGDPNHWKVCEYVGFDLKHDTEIPWNVAFLANERGFQEAKFVPAAQASMAINVAQRDYFRQVLEKRTSCYNRPCTDEAEIGAEIVRSATSGEIVLVAARRVEAVAAGSDHTLIGVAALETSLSSFRNLTLPMGTHAVVVDRAGKVLVHSGDDAAYGQDFLADLDSSTELRAALVNESPGSLEVRYMGAPSRIRVAPLGLRGLGWTVLAIAPASFVDVATSDMVIISMFGMMGIVLLVVLGGCVVALFTRAGWILGLGAKMLPVSGPGLHLRPILDRAQAYGAVGVWMIRVSMILCLVSLLTSRYVPISIFLLLNAALAWVSLSRVPGFGVHLPFAAYLERVFKKKPLAGQGPLPIGFAYCLCLLGLAGMFVVAPSTIMFSGAYDHVTDALVRAEQYDFSNRLRYRQECLENPTREATAHCANVVWGDEAETATTTVASVTASCIGSPISCLADYLPPSGCDAFQKLGRLYRWEIPPPIAAEDKAGDFELRRAGGALQLVSLRENRALRSVSLPGLLSTRYNLGRLMSLLLVFFGFLAGSSALVFRSVERLFFLDLPEPSAPKLDLSSVTPQSRIILPFADEQMREEIESSIEAMGFHSLAPRVFWLDPSRLCVDDFKYDSVSSPVLLLCADDPLRVAPPNSRAQWAQLLKGWEVVGLSRPYANAIGANPSLAQLTALYDSCDEAEQQVLAQLALGGYANPHPNHRETVRRLLRRGILSPVTLTIQSAEFSEFIRSSVTTEQQERWEQADSGTDWQALRAPLSAAVVAIFGALTVSKPELGAASALVPTLAAGLPTIFKVLLQLAQRGSAS